MPLIYEKAFVMGVTRLKRKARRNKQTAAKRNNSIKQLTAQPVIKNIDKEALKASFAPAEAPKKSKAKKEKAVKEAPKAEVEAVEETPVVEEVKAEETVEEAPVVEEPKAEAAEEETEATVEESNEEAKAK